MIFVVMQVTYTLTPNGQIWPRSLNSVIGGETGKIYLVASDVSVPPPLFPNCSDV